MRSGAALAGGDRFRSIAAQLDAPPNRFSKERPCELELFSC
jgi:hypothetical protein